MTIRLIDFGTVDPLRSLAIFHGVAYAMTTDHPDTITLTRPHDPFVSIGHHQDATAEVDLEYCDEAGVPVYRREREGGELHVAEVATESHSGGRTERRPACRRRRSSGRGRRRSNSRPAACTTRSVGGRTVPDG